MIAVQILIGVVVLLVLGGLLAPLESLNWWTRLDLEATGRIAPPLPSASGQPAAEVPPEANHYLVYLSGIGVISGQELPPKERPMVDELNRRIGDTRMIWDVYPYSPNNRGLTGERPMAWMWRKLGGMKGTRGGALAALINVRNGFQMFVSMDKRYGPLFDAGVAREIYRALLRHGYRPENARPVTLLGWSGGGQIAVGASWYLASMGVPVRVLSMGGIISSDAGLDRVAHLWHLYGSRDWLQTVTRFFFPGRWGIAKRSHWNRAVAQGRVSMIEIGPLAHMGKDDYFDQHPPLPDGDTPFGVTVDAIVTTLVRFGFATDNGPRPQDVVHTVSPAIGELKVQTGRSGEQPPPEADSAAPGADGAGQGEA